MGEVLALNGSPRKKWNTAMLLEKALEGARSKGKETDLIHLYDLDFSGCTSCFACKLKGGKSYGRCSVKDDLTPILDRIHEADALILGSPIYFGCVTGEMRSCMERLMFQYLVYTSPPSTLFSRKLKTAFIYTMNVPENMIEQVGYSQQFAATANVLGRVFQAPSETFWSCETLQFDDYSKYVFSYCDPEERKERRKTVFPKDLKKAHDLGVKLSKS